MMVYSVIVPCNQSTNNQRIMCNYFILPLNFSTLEFFISAGNTVPRDGASLTVNPQRCYACSQIIPAHFSLSDTSPPLSFTVSGNNQRQQF